MVIFFNAQPNYLIAENTTVFWSYWFGCHPALRMYPWTYGSSINVGNSFPLQIPYRANRLLQVGVVTDAVTRGRWQSTSRIPIFHRRRRVSTVNTRIWLTRGEKKTTLTTTWGINYSFCQVKLNRKCSFVGLTADCLLKYHLAML